MKLAVFLVALTILRLFYIGQVELSPDEAQYHEWSKRMDWCYFSKGPGVAATIWAGTKLFGHGEFGVRFFAPILALGTSLLLYWLARRIYDARVALWTVLVLNATPIFNAGGLVMTIDPLSIFFWSAALCTLWLAFEKSPAFSLWWPLSGLLIAAGMLCKWTNAAMLASVILLLAMTPRYRREFFRPGFWTMLVAVLLPLIPAALWQQARDWPTLHHLSARGGLETPWWKVSFGELGKFVAMHFGVYSPLIFLGMMVALWDASTDSFRRWGRAALRAPVTLPKAIARHWPVFAGLGLLALGFFFAGNFWEISVLHKTAAGVLALALAIGLGQGKEPANVHWKSRFLAAFALPLILGYLWIAMHHDGEVNWTAPAMISVFVLTAGYWIDRLSKPLARAAFGIAIAMTIIGLQPDLVRAVGIPWPAKYDHTNRLRGWSETAQAVEAVRLRWEAKLKENNDDASLFLIGENYGLASELCYYLPPPPPSRPPLPPGHPACYVEASVVPASQYHFWGRYDEFETRQSSVTNPYEGNSEVGWSRFRGGTAIYVTARAEGEPPDVLIATFENWTRDQDITIFENGRPIRKLRIFICHRYKPLQMLN